MKLSLGQAAKECGKSKATISKAIKSGKLSVMGQTSAGYEIDPAELFRVFPKPAMKRGAVNDANDGKPSQDSSMFADMAIELGRTKAERDSLKERLDEMRRILERAESNADEWRKQAQTLALTDQRERKGGLFGMFKKAG